MPLLTRGFASYADLQEHFESHVTIKQEFAVANEAEYLALADNFLGGVLDSTTTYECQRTCKDGTGGDIVRYNRVTQEFGILSVDNVIRTYYIPNLAIHGFQTNYDYFIWNCNRRRG